MEKIVCFLFLSISGCFGNTHVVYNDCNANQRMMHVNTVSLSPYPVNIPGDLTVSGSGILGKNLTGSYSLKVNIHKKTLGFIWAPIPCVANYGSCTYDLCTLLRDNFAKNGQENCPPQMAKQNIGCTCPFAAGPYTLQASSWHIPEMASFMAWLSSGDYKVDVTLTDKATGEQVGCYHVEITFAHPCSGFGCIFG